MNVQDMVLEFHRAVGAAIAAPIEQWGEDRLGLLYEEYDELAEAVRAGDYVAIMRELADIAYYAYGTAIALGYQLDPVIAEVHRANLSKLGDDGRPILRQWDGKVLKGPNFRPPDVAAVCGMNRLERDSLVEPDSKSRPIIITLCGSTRFRDEFAEANRTLTLQGYLVISVGLFGHSGDLPPEQCVTGSSPVKIDLDQLHLRKIDLADEIFVVNPGGYIGESTRREIAYAERLGRRVRYLETVSGKSAVLQQEAAIGSEELQ